ncbi:MAG: hypothetical protein EHM28_08205 [Spirochaetaceae bacterium]|nr:MAG: hypothetical protein EHM28_08205 [Spirochaetaceae bacterium]
MPKITYILLVGIAGMFLAPFGMLISKWAALKALVDANPILAVIVIFGSAATLFFWTKWMGKLTTVINPQPNIEKEVRAADWTSLSILAVLTILLCLFFPLASTVLIDPYINSVYHTVISMEQGNLLIMLIMLVMLIILPVILMISVTRGRAKMEYMYTDAYLGGTNTRKPFKYFGSMGRVVNVQTENYYLGSLFDEKRIFKIGVVVSIILLFALSVAAGVHFAVAGMVGL